ncbi:MAG: xanthine dehydrogenase small subunit [Pseudomonadales bacterium]
MTDSVSQLWVNAAPLAAPACDPNQSLLQFLRDDAGLMGTKEGCASGDCGACTVVVADHDGANPQTLNSCITPLGAVLQRQVLTVEGVGQPGNLHPVQDAMVTEHGSQCGFCTPGFVMSMVGRQLQAEDASQLGNLSRDELIVAISGNLCRCTGYRPILAAAAKANAAVAGGAAAKTLMPVAAADSASMPDYHCPQTEPELQALLSSGLPLVAGSTDLWLEVTQRYRDFPGFIDLTRIPSLQTIEQRADRLHIGAAVTHAQLERYFADGPHDCPAIVALLHRFGSPQVRNRATLGGNIANASPIADWPPVLLVLDAQVQIKNAAGALRSVALETFYRGYKDTELQPQEYIAAIDIDANAHFAALQAFKISKREDDDISSTMGAFAISLANGVIDQARIAFGGVAATPVRLLEVEQRLLGQPINETTIAMACYAVTRALQPISDVRASADYRREVSAQLLRKALIAVDPKTRFEPQTLSQLLDQ